MTRPNAPSAAYRGFVVMAFVVIILAGIKAASPDCGAVCAIQFSAVICNPAIGLMTKFRVPKMALR